MQITKLRALILTAVWWFPVAAVHAHHQAAATSQLADGEPSQKYDQQEEDFVRTPSGFEKAGERRMILQQEAATLKVKIVDKATGEPTACRVNVVGPEGHYYEPQNYLLEPYNANNVGCHVNGETHAPSRYFGWYFYTLGEFAVKVPEGQVRIEVWKGYEYRPVQQTVTVGTGEPKVVEIELERSADLQQYGYYAGDTHIHMKRRNAEDDERALDLMSAEDIQYGFILCMNDPRIYSGRMDLQEWPQKRGFGANSVQQRGIYGIASAQEYRSKEYGHICLLMHDRLVLEGATINPNNWPVFGLVGLETRERGGYAFHAHGGYSKEIFADYVQRATDGVELLQMAHYRGIGLTGWYRILNLGFRFPGLAGSDFPYVRALGDCRTYVYSAKRPSFAEWAKHAAEGRSFFTTGPLLLLEVDGKRPGDILNVKGGQAKQVQVKVDVRSEVTPIEHVELIVNGKVTQRWDMPKGDKSMGIWHKLEIPLEIEKPSWIAARAYGISPTGRSDAEAHTNPVYVYLDGKKPFEAADVDWLVEQLDGQIEELKSRDFREQMQAREFF